jgi:RNA polymerase sigma factor (sigma-70 family)
MAVTLSLTSTPPACAEHVLVAAARAGDDRAFEELYARYQERISAFIFSKVRDHGRAEDISQEVFISALRRLRSSDQQIAFKPWIYEIAKNACIDEFRRGARTREVPLQADDDVAGGQRGLQSVTPTPPAAVENKQRLTDLQGAFGGLSDSHHKLLVMREFEGLSYEEIGNRLGMTRQMVESGLFRARRKLTDEYGELASGRRCEQVQSAIDAGPARSLRSLGIRERRRLHRHLAHCQPCRHTARLAGVDQALLQPRSVTKKIAALLPFPLWRWIWRGRRGGDAAGAGSGHHHLIAAESLQTAARVAEPASSSVTLGQAAAAAAALAIAGAGGGIVGGLTGHRHLNRQATAALAAGTAGRRPQAAAKTPATAATPSAASLAKRASLAGAGRSGRRGDLASGVIGLSRVSGAGTGRRVPSSAGTGGPATPPTTATASGTTTTTPAGGVSTATLPTAVKPSTVTGPVQSTVSTAGHIVSTAGHIASSVTHSVVSASPPRSSTPSVKSTVGGVLSAGLASSSTPSTGVTNAPTPTLKSTVSSPLP